MRGSSAQKMKLTSYDDLFGGDGQESGEAVTSVPIRDSTHLGGILSVSWMMQKCRRQWRA